MSALMRALPALTVFAATAAAQGTPAQQPQQPMGFFVTSVGKGDGANLGGLAGADAHCQALAKAAGRGDAMWRAYLSTQGQGAVNARDESSAAGTSVKIGSTVSTISSCSRASSSADLDTV